MRFVVEISSSFYTKIEFLLSLWEFLTEDMGFEPTHAVIRLPRFQHGLLSLLSNLPILTQIVYHKATYLAIKILEIRKMIEFERK